MLACNDDFYSGAPCGTFVSRIEDLLVEAGTTYYIVVDGYGSACGSYQLEIREVVTVHDRLHRRARGRATADDDYVDLYNGGCNTDPQFPFQYLSGDIERIPRAVWRSGWYTLRGQPVP